MNLNLRLETRLLPSLLTLRTGRGRLRCRTSYTRRLGDIIYSEFSSIFRQFFLVSLRQVSF